MPVEVYAFLSSKGGTGKTTLAVATALGLAARGGRVAVYDMDLVGSSIGDGLPLCAPDTAGPDGRVDLAALAPRLLNRSATLAARSLRARGRTSGVHLPYLNDALLHTAQQGDGPSASAYVWRRDAADSVAWFPSSPCLHDVAVASSWLNRPDFDKLGLRFFDLTAEAVTALGLNAIILDLPPGIAGFTETLLRRYRRADGPFAAITPVFVTTPDRNDLFPSVDYFSRAVLAYPAMKFILNRNRHTLAQVRADVRRVLGGLLGPARAEDRLRAISFHPDTLGRLFVVDGLGIPEPVLSEILGSLEIP